VILPHDVELGENREFCRKTFTDISQNSTVLSLATVKRHAKKKKNKIKRKNSRKKKKKIKN